MSEDNRTIQGDELNPIQRVDIRYTDENGNAYGIKQVNNKIRVSSMPYLYDISEGNISGHEPFILIGKNGDVDAATETLWGVGGGYVPPAPRMQMEVVSSDAEDTGVVIKNGTSDSITEVATVDGGRSMTLTDAAVDFGAATAVVIGDCVLLDGDMINGLVTNVNVNDITFLTYYVGTLTSAQDYRVVDASTGGTGVKVATVHYLNSDYEENSEFIVTNGLTAVVTVAEQIIRINRFHAIFRGTAGGAVGRVDIRHLTNAPIYGSIPVGFNSNEDCFYTVPTGKTLYITRWNMGSGFSTANRLVQSWLRTTSSHNGEYTIDRWDTKDMMLTQDGIHTNGFDTPIKVPARADVKISVACPETNAIAVGHIVGWLEDAE